MTKIRLGVFASGTGSNAVKIMDHFSNHPKVEIAFLLSNKSDAPVVKHSREKGIKTIVLSNTEVDDGDLLNQVCKDEKTDFIVLAGYLRKIPVKLIHQYHDRIINIHPSLLPRHGGKGMYGKHVHEAVLSHGDQEAGISIHFVNEQFDEGRIIAQFRCSVDSSDTIETLQAKIQQLEHSYFPFVVEKTVLKYEL